MEDEMSKPEFVEMVEEDMDFEAELEIRKLCKYADENFIDCDFVFETFLNVFRKKINTESWDME
jgi:hypothetical protein